MYEPYTSLKIKAKAGIASAKEELAYRKCSREELPLKGIGGTALCMVRTEELLKKLETLTSLYEQVQKGRLREVLLLDAYHSATIEGARTTVEQVRKAYTAPKTKDDKMVVNTMHAMHYAYEKPIGMENIRALWEIVVKDVCENENLAGTFFRSGMVYVGSSTEIVHTPPAPEKIEGMMKTYFAFQQTSDLNPWLTACILHFYFVYVHPFCDGNGRMARILTQSYLRHQGLDKIQFLPISRAINMNLAGYYRTLRQSEERQENGKSWIDITPFLDYLLDAMSECMVSSIREERKLSESQRTLLTKMKKRGKGAEMTIASAARILAVSQQTAGRALNGLAKAGYLEKRRTGKKNLYLLK